MAQIIHQLSTQSVRTPIIRLKERLRVVRHRILRNQLQKQGEPFTVTPARALVFAPHPDDETLGCGGFIALKCDQKVQVDVVILTDGSACFGSIESVSAQALTDLREGEAVRAMALLGVPKAQIHFLRQPDSRLSSLTESDRHTLLKQLIELLERLRPQEVLVPHQLDNTPDHETTFSLVQSALKDSSLCPVVLQYPIWRFWSGSMLDISSLPPSELLGLRRLNISEVLERKRKAFTCYESQYSTITPFNTHEALPKKFREAFELKYEIFFVFE